MILVTGANGFLGQALVTTLKHREFEVRAATRREMRDGSVPVGEIGPDTDWRTALRGVDTVIHTAARVHVMRDSAADPLAQFRRVNVQGTLVLARQAADASVKRFIFISSIKVNGESTEPGRPFSAEDRPAPGDAYALSKREAEDALTALARATGLELVIIRPPLVYGPGVGANFERMMRWVRRGIPLPLRSVRNRRSLVAIDNLVDLIVTCIDHPDAANQTFVVSDDEDLSTAELLRRIGVALDHPARLFPVPVPLLVVAASVLGKKAEVQRLCGWLQVDMSKTRKRLGWEPPVGLDEALRKTAAHFVGN